jgi:stage II sporulation protein E
VKEVCAESLAGSVAVGVKMKGCGNDGGISLESVVSGACGVSMQKASVTPCGAGAYSMIRFEQAKQYRAQTGFAKLTKEEVSGDSHVAVQLKDGRYLLMLCDGMGSGETAYRESAAAVSLVENFFKAGFDDAVIFDTINRLLQLKGSDEVFTTVDLCVLDLKTGSTRFTKIGAESSFILNNEGVMEVSPGSLPMGIIDEVKPVSAVHTLAAGDMVVMMSDGIADEIGDDFAEWFSDIDLTDVQSAADTIIDKALGGRPPRDDMTVMVTRLITA